MLIFQFSAIISNHIKLYSSEQPLIYKTFHYLLVNTYFYIATSFLCSYMGFFNKLMFWKKDELGDLKKELGSDFSMGDSNLGLGGEELGLQGSDAGMPNDTWSNQAYPNYPQQPSQASSSYGRGSAHQRSYPQPAQQFERPVLIQQQDNDVKGYTTQKDFEVISAKLDALRAGIDAMNQRLATLEREIRQKRW
jgi:hypothetical protein